MKVQFTVGVPDKKKHSTKFTQLGETMLVDGVERPITEVFEGPMTQYVPAPFGHRPTARQLRVTIEEL